MTDSPILSGQRRTRPKTTSSESQAAGFLDLVEGWLRSAPTDAANN